MSENGRFLNENILWNTCQETLLVSVDVRMCAFCYIYSGVIVIDQKLVCTILPLKVMSQRFFSAIPYNICDSMRESSEDAGQHD